ncbi:MAG: bacillithiol biosynthesis deacetylase BshB1 [Bacteroidetes bacterium]|nr:MAG: bacillithiol biosynthesis deacetylase BshB1 [Bacteroidota bacterium]
MKVDILAIGIHPDDVELSASGTLLRHAELGYSFGLLDLTLGELGSRGSAEIRTKEALRAAEILGAAFRKQLDLPDGFFTNGPGNKLKVIEAIREYRPRIVLCNAPDDRHPDHGRSARMVSEACFYSGLIRIETTGPDGRPQQEWRPNAVYHYIQDKQLTPDFVVDITPYFKKKMEAIKAFQSQFYDEAQPDAWPQTPISGKGFLAFMEAKARVYGRPPQVQYAEGFICARTPAVNNLFDLT